MKTVFLASVAAATLFAAPAFAQNVGSVGITYGNTSVNDIDGDVDAVKLDGVVAMPAFGDWTVTVAGGLNYVDTDFGDSTNLEGAVHLTTLATPDLRVGGFVAAQDLGAETALTVGAEVQKYLANATLTGLVSYTSADDLDLDVWTIGADAGYYVMPNLRLNAGVSYNSVEQLGNSADAWTYGVGAEYEFANTPYSVNAAYTRADIESLDVDTWTIGMRYSFGGGLQARDRAGASLKASSIVSTLGF